MDKRAYYSAVAQNISILKGLGYVFSDGDYFCPLCMAPFTLEEVKKLLTEEDVPQASLGGKRITLTCRKCNSKCGSEIDIHLFNAIKAREQSAFFPGTDRQVVLLAEGKSIKANLQVGINKNFSLQINTEKTSPELWKFYYSNILLPNNTIDVKDVPLKRDSRRISSAIIKNAYCLLFAKTGYTILNDKHYDSMREQIKRPEPYILPERLWTIQNLPVPDGIYLTTDNQYRGFFVIYSLHLKLSYKVCVLIPTPKVDFLSACIALRTFEPCSSILVNPLPNLDYLQDTNAIIRLRDWCYGWQMNF